MFLTPHRGLNGTVSNGPGVGKARATEPHSYQVPGLILDASDRGSGPWHTDI